MMLWDVPQSQESGTGLRRPTLPSGLGAQPPVTPLQQEIVQFHQKVIGMGVLTLNEQENRSYLELRLQGTCSSQSLPRLWTHWATWLILWPLHVFAASVDNNSVRSLIWFFPSLRLSALRLKFRCNDLQYHVLPLFKGCKRRVNTLFSWSLKMDADWMHTVQTSTEITNEQLTVRQRRNIIH